MAIEDIYRALEQEGEREVKDILSKAREEANQIVEEANEEARQVKEIPLQKAAASIKGEQARLLNDAKLFKKKAVIKAKEECINNAFTKVKDELKDIRSKSSYKEVFTSLAKEVLGMVEGKVVASVDKRDEKLAGSVLDSLGADYELKTDITCLGGLRVVSAGGRISHVNTLDSRLDKAKQAIKPEVTSILFS